jgi:hypothetical protein
MEMAKSSGKKDKSLSDLSNLAINENPGDLKEKEAIVAQAEASNSAALSDVSAKKSFKAEKSNFVPLKKTETEGE